MADSDDPVNWFPLSSDKDTPAAKAAPAAPPSKASDDPVNWFPLQEAAPPATAASAAPPAPTKAITDLGRGITDLFGRGVGAVSDAIGTTRLQAAPGPGDAGAYDVPGTSPEGQATPALSAEEARNRLHEAQANMLHWGAQTFGTGYGGKAAMLLPYAATRAAEIPLDIAIGLKQGPAGAVTIDPNTNALGLTPEAQAAAGLGVRPLQFGGKNPLLPPGLHPTEPPPLPPEFQPGPVPGASATGPTSKIPPEGGEPPKPPPGVQPEEEAPKPSDTPPETGASDSEAPRARAAGAQATPEDQAAADLSDRQRANELKKQIDQTASDRAENNRDDTPYVTDVPGGQLPPRVEAERNFDTQSAFDHVYKYQHDADYQGRYLEQQKPRDQGMIDLLRNDAGDLNTIDQASTARREAVSPDNFGAWDNQQPVPQKTAEINQQIEDMLDHPDAKSAAVQRTLTGVQNMLTDRAGNPEVIPQRLFGVRQAVDRLLQKAQAAKRNPMDMEGSDALATEMQLRQILSSLDDGIQSGAPNYADWRGAWRDSSQTINQQRFLQQYFEGNKNVVGADGMLDERKLNTMLSDVYNGLKAPGFNTVKSLTDQQIQNIVNVRNEVAARNNAWRIGRGAKGMSPTSRMFSRAAEKGIGPLGYAMHMGLGEGLEHLGNYFQIPGVAEFGQLYRYASPWIRSGAAARNLNRLKREDAQLSDRLLAPGPTNPLQPPP